MYVIKLQHTDKKKQGMKKNNLFPQEFGEYRDDCVFLILTVLNALVNNFNNTCAQM